MPTSPTTLTAAPTSPDRADRATFAARAVALDDWTKNTQIPELQAAINNAYANTVEAYNSAVTCTALTSVAAAAANYKGLWSTLTGALNMPASVSHNGNYWALNANLADVTAATPGVSASWQPLNIGAGGATETNSAVDVTLTAASYRVQAVAMTTAGKSVIMPDATTVQTGGEIIVIKNTGALAFTARNTAGTLLCAVDPGQLAFLYLVNGSTSAGVWAVGNSTATALAQTLYQATALTVNAVSSTHVAVTQMSATQAIAVWAGASGYINCCTLNISGTTITAGTVLVVNAASSRFTSVAAVSATQAVLIYAGTGDYLNCCTLNVSGTTLTAGAVLIVNAAASVYGAVAAMSATQAIVTYSGTSSYTQACTLNISGTTLTAGAILSVNAINSSYQAITPLSATQAIIAYSSGSDFVQCCTLNVSGTTLTNGTVITLNAENGMFPKLAAMSSTQAVIAYPGGSTTNYLLNVRTLDVSGTNLTAGGIFVQQATPVVSTYAALEKITANKLALIASAAGTGTGYTNTSRAQILGLTDGQISGGPPAMVKTAAGAYGDLAVMSETKVLAVYLETSGYVQARVLEIAA